MAVPRLEELMLMGFDEAFDLPFIAGLEAERIYQPWFRGEPPLGGSVALLYVDVRRFIILLAEEEESKAVNVLYRTRAHDWIFSLPHQLHHRLHNVLHARLAEVVPVAAVGGAVGLGGEGGGCSIEPAVAALYFQDLLQDRR